MSIAQQVKEYIDSHPSVKNCLKQDLINFSSLSRQIASELKLGNQSSFDAILVALRRFQQKMSSSSDFDAKIKKVLAGSKLEIETGICVCVLSQKISDSALEKLLSEIKESNETYHLIHGSHTITIYTAESNSQKFRDIFGSHVLYTKSKLIQINLRTNPEIMKTQGVMALVFSLLGENNINVVDCITSWTDNILIVNKKDVTKCIELLQFK